MERIYIKAGKIIALCMVIALVAPLFRSDADEDCVFVSTVYADNAEEIRDDAKEEIKELQEQMDNLEEFQEQIAADLENAAEEMEALMAVQSELSESIMVKQAEIEDANTALLEALTKESETYEAMKLRIQYMYENDISGSIGNVLLEAESVADILSTLEYAKSIYEADRRLMEEYKQAIADVEIKQEQLALEMEELLAMQEEYDIRQANLEVYIEGLSADAESFEVQLANAEEQIAEYEAVIVEQERIIAEQKAAEEAARKAREEAERQAALNNNNNSNSANNNSGNQEANLGSSSYLTDPSYDPAFTSDVSGEELVEYALQFVGNPYVWGGNSLTEGCDCSGFVKLIYEHFGFDTPRYSQSFKTYGKPVAFENIKAGDIVVYPGHVAIYIGNGYIVEAQSTKRGITCNRLVTCSKITAIRRAL